MTQNHRVAVFGGSGFLGHHLVQRLMVEGWDVRVAVRNPAPVGEARGEPPKPTSIRADITKSDAEIAAAVTDMDAVVNLVGILVERGPATFQRVHVEGAGRVARAASAAGVSWLVHISALGADPAATSAYARSKAASEAAVRAAFPAATIFRPSLIIGPGDHFFTRFARMARLLPALPLIGGGRTRFQPVYVGDVVAAIVRALDDPAAQGRTYELGGPRTYTFADLMRLMLATIRRRRLLVSLPFPLASVQGAALEWLPHPPLTRDQVEQLKQDNVMSPGAPGLAALGLTPTPIEPVVATYLEGRP